MKNKSTKYTQINTNKKHLKNVGPIRHNEPPHANSPDVASGTGTVARRLRIDVYDNANDDDDDDDDDDNDNAWQRGPLWPHEMGTINLGYAQWNAPSVTKPNPENYKNCSSKCAYDCAQLSYK